VGSEGRYSAKLASFALDKNHGEAADCLPSFLFDMVLYQNFPNPLFSAFQVFLLSSSLKMTPLLVVATLLDLFAAVTSVFAVTQSVFSGGV